jgi:hypothetical protein
VNPGISRRAFLSVIPLGVAAQVNQPHKIGKPLAVVGEFARITDPVTENVVIRLTSLSSASVLPFARNSFISTRERTLIFSSNRGGKFAPLQIDLHTGAVRQMAEAARLDPKSLSFDHQEKAIRYLDGNSLFEVTLGHGSPKRLGDGYSAFGSTVAGVLFLLSGGKILWAPGNELRNARPLAEGADALWPQPNGAGCLFARARGQDQQELYYVPINAGLKPSLVTAGKVHEPCWDADGESILFLRDVTSPNGTILSELHGKSVRGGDEHLVSPTSQFACFAPNSDASVFVGASRSRAQPNVIIMLRFPQREMTLCEHRDSHPDEVTPVFSPDNRRIYFQSNREGNSAIYTVNVEQLVEPSASGSYQY